MRKHHRSAGGVAIANSRQQDALSLAKAFEPSRPARPSPLAASTIRGIPVDLVDRIRSFSFFAEAPEDFLVAIGSCLRLQVHAAHESILSEGEEAKAMYWLIRGSVVVASRDRESIYAELRPGALFGEIGILMNVPRTASVVTRSKSLVARLNKEDLQKQLPSYPKVERALREEAAERLAILERKKAQAASAGSADRPVSPRKRSKRSYALVDDDVEMSDGSGDESGRRESNKKLKPPSPSSMPESGSSGALSKGAVNVRQLLKNLPLFDQLPDEFLHFLGLNAEAKHYPPFTTILKERTTGRDVFFITEGTVEVFTESPPPPGSSQAGTQDIKARLYAGNFFGEVTSLWLAPERTASVRTVNTVECLVIRGIVIDEIWRRCPTDIRRQIEDVARQRLQANTLRSPATGAAALPAQRGQSIIDADIAMLEVGDKSTSSAEDQNAPHSPIMFRDVAYQGSAPPSPTSLEPFDPDPFFNNPDRLARRPTLSRRGSLANTITNAPAETSPLANDGSKRRSQPDADDIQMVDRPHAPPRPRMSSSQASHPEGPGALSDTLLVLVFQNLDFYDLMRLRQVCVHWQRLINRHPDILPTLDLSKYNRFVTDTLLINVIVPFVGSRPRTIDISNCFHVTDEGFSALGSLCGENVTHWRMKSVWEISPGSIIHMTTKAPNLVSVDFSNCRKVSDSLLTRIVGWVVRPHHHQHHQNQPLQAQIQGQEAQGCQSNAPTVIGCPKLRRLILSYCKHVSDRFMQHLAHHAADRLEEMDLTRCTTISDTGFRYWSERPFASLRKLVLADCTYLSDAAITHLAHAARGLTDLDLSFCCALSDAAVERVATGLPRMRRLDLAFCGSAVSDASMANIGRGLKELRVLSVRGCVRVTRQGVEAVMTGCKDLEVFDVSQCRNLTMDPQWIGARVKFNTVADGKWRVGK